jgi:polyisoprenoid-binding protein YceI
VEETLMKRGVLSALALSAVMSAAVLADAKLGQASGATVNFHGKAIGLNLTGTTNELKVSEDGGNVKFAVPLATLKTGIALRDTHMRDKYLEVGKYPEAVLVVPRSGLSIPDADGKQTAGKVSGSMTIHGQTKPVTINYKAKRVGANAYDISGDTEINIKDYGIDAPSYGGLVVKPDIKVELTSARVTDAS